MAISVMDEVSKSRGLKIAIWIAVAIFLFAALMQLPKFYLQYVSPYEAARAEAIKPEFLLGEPIEISYDINRKRICKVDLDRFISDKATGSVVWRDRVPGGARQTGFHKDVLNTIPVPPSALKPREDMPRRCFTLHTTIYNECAEGVHTASAPTAEFCVVNSEDAK